MGEKLLVQLVQVFENTPDRPGVHDFYILFHLALRPLNNRLQYIAHWLHRPPAGHMQFPQSLENGSEW